MLRTLIVILVAVYLSACDSRLNQINMRASDLMLKQIPCRYSAYKNVIFTCYAAERQDNIKHAYLVTVISPVSESKLPREAVLAIPGGPGQGAQTSDAWVENWADFFVSSQLDIDLVLFDPPGTIGSDAYWRCDEYEEAALSLSSKNMSFEEESGILEPVLNSCLQTYHQRLIRTGFSEHGITALASDVYAQRLSLLMEGLPYEQYHLLGTSYGTRVALMLARDEQVATLTLDSAYPFSRGSLLDTPALLDHSHNLHRRFYRNYYDELESYDQVFEKAMNELALRPQLWKLERWDGQSDVRFMLTSSRLRDVSFSVLYDEGMLEYFYAGLREIASKPDSLRWVLEDFVTQAYDPTFSTLTFIATECADNRRVSYQDYMAEVEKYPELSENWKEIYEFDVCDHAIFENITPVQNLTYANKPTLVFSGELDPVTPVFWNEELEKQMDNVKIIKVAGVGHAVLGTERCETEALLQFWTTRSVSTEIVCTND